MNKVNELLRMGVHNYNLSIILNQDKKRITSFLSLTWEHKRTGSVINVLCEKTEGNSYHIKYNN